MRPSARAMHVADDQLGLVTRRQLLALGLTDHQIRHLLAVGALIALHVGIYRSAGSLESFEQRCLAATFACGDGAVVSHLASAALRRLVPEPERIDVTVPEARRARRPGIVVHHSIAVGAPDVTYCGLVPVTRPARTLVDIAPVFDEDRFELICDDAFRRFLVSPDAVIAYLDRPEMARKAGRGRLWRIAHDRVTGGLSESDLETPMIRLLRMHHLPEPVRQYKVRLGGRSVRFDFAYPDDNLAIEPGGPRAALGA